MPASGYLTASMGAYFEFYIYWEVVSVNEAAGTYKVYISWGVRKKAANSVTYNLDASLWAAYAGTSLLNGEEVAWDMRSASVGAEQSLYRTTRTVSCDENGNRQLWLWGYFDPGNLTYADAAEIGAYVTLPTIHRATEPVLSASSADMGTQVTIDLTGAKNSAFTHTLTYKLPDGTTGTIASGLGAVAYAWTVPDFAAQIPNAASGAMEITCTTYNAAGEDIGSVAMSLTATVPAGVAPVISAVEVTEVVSDIAARFGAFVQSKSKVKVTITAAGAKGSTVKSVSSVFDGTAYSGTSWTSGYIGRSGTVNIVTTVTDSRGRSVKKTTPVTVLAYTKPQIQVFRVYRCDAYGTAYDDGTYAAIQLKYALPSLNGGNTAAIVIEYKQSTEADYTFLMEDVTPLDVDTILYPALPTFPIESSFDLRLTVTDYFGTAIPAEDILPTVEVILDVNSSGKGLGIGKMSECDGVEIAWPIVGLDYVVEQGQSGNWTYQKWASGICEVWGFRDITASDGIDCTTEYGALFCTGYIDPPDNFPQIIVYPKATFFGYESGYGYPGYVECAQYLSANASKAQSVRIVRPKSAEGMAGRLTWLYKGFWLGAKYIPVDAASYVTADGKTFRVMR